MNQQVEAMKLAKAWFEQNTYGDEAVDVYEALCEALAEQPAQQEIVALDGQRKLVQILTENWRVWPARKAVEQTSLGDVYCSEKGRDLMFGNHEIASDQDSAVVTKEMWSTMRQALAEQPAQQEPLGFMNAGSILEMQQKSLPYGYVYPEKSTGVSVAVYTSPPAQPQQEPVACKDCGAVIKDGVVKCVRGRSCWVGQQPAQRKPLTDGELEEIVKRGAENKPFHHWFARAIEAAHGIKGDPHTKLAAPQPAQPVIAIQQAYDMGAKGGEPTLEEKALFEAWMQGHCWLVEGDWDGKTYVHESERTGYLHPGAMLSRQLWAAWRDRAALSNQKEQS